MAQASDLPCDGDGVCMVCKKKPPPEGETVACKTCATPWHVPCLTVPPASLEAAREWVCPDCSDLGGGGVDAAAVGGGGVLVEKIRAIEADASLTDREKAKRRQELMGGGGAAVAEGEKGGGGAAAAEKVPGGVLAILGDKFNCSICMQLLDRPVSTPCGHNFCLKCFQKWVGQQRKKTCAICRKSIPVKMAREPRINSAIVMAIRTAKLSQSNVTGGPPKPHHFIHNQDRPDKAFTTERAKKTGKANACSGKIFVTVPLDYFGPITAENDPQRNTGVLVGETWEDRMECRQWGAHFPHVAGICGQADHGAQSVALSGGYEDDEDHGDWFLYTGSGGRDLSGNKRTNKVQSFDQTFEKFNEALRVSCREGYPLRVVRSHKEKRSSYAPQGGVRYDGVYRIEKCWRKDGIQGFKVCRYLFVRCDNEPAPWMSDNLGDRPRSSLPPVPELKQAVNVTERKKSPAWDYDEQEGRWKWMRPQPESRKAPGDYEAGDGSSRKRKRKNPKGSVKEKLLKEFSCLICRKVMELPLTTPCAHNFCKGCLEGVFAGQSFVKERTNGGRSLRTQKNVMKCPSCKNDISEFLQNPQVNRELMNVIESLQNQMEEEQKEESEKSENSIAAESTEAEVTTEDAAKVEVSADSSEKAGNESENVEIPAVEIAENKENCDVNAEIPKSDKGDKGAVKPSNATKPQRASKRKKAAEVEAEAEAGGDEAPSNATKPQRASKRKKASEAEAEAEAAGEEAPAKAEKPKRSYKRNI